MDGEGPPIEDEFSRWIGGDPLQKMPKGSSCPPVPLAYAHVAGFDLDDACLISGGSVEESPNGFGVVALKVIDIDDQLRLGLFEGNRKAEKDTTPPSVFENRCECRFYFSSFGLIV